MLLQRILLLLLCHGKPTEAQGGLIRDFLKYWSNIYVSHYCSRCCQRICCTYHVHRTPSTLMCTRTYFYIVYGPYKLVTSFTMMHCALDELSAHEVMYLLRESL
jgi:hypothetical protein